MLHEQTPEAGSTVGIGEDAVPTRFVRLRHRLPHLQGFGERRECRRGEVLLRAGEIPTSCYFVRRGQVAAVKGTERGNEIFLCVMEENSMLAEANMLFHRVLPVTFRTTMPSVVYRISEQALRHKIEEDPALAMTVMESIADKLFAVAAESEKSKSHDAAWMFCDLLIELAQHYGVAYDGKILIQKKISIDTMTSLMGVNRATTVRAIRSLKDVDLLEYINGYYCVRSIEKLRRHQELQGSL